MKTGTAPDLEGEKKPEFDAQENEVTADPQEVPQKNYYGSDEPLPRSSYMGCGGYRGP